MVYHAIAPASRENILKNQNVIKKSASIISYATKLLTKLVINKLCFDDRLVPKPTLFFRKGFEPPIPNSKTTNSRATRLVGSVHGTPAGAAV